MTRKRRNKSFRGSFKTAGLMNAARGWVKPVLVFAVLVAVLLALVCGIFTYVCHDRQFNIALIEIRSDGELTPQAIRKAAGVSEGMNLLGLNIRAVARRLEANPHVQRAIVRRVLPNRLRIEVRERHPILQLHIRRLNKYYLLDREGVVLPSIQRPPLEGVVVLECSFAKTGLDVGQRFEKKLVGLIDEVLRYWRKNPRLSKQPIRAVEVDDARASTLVLDNNVKIMLGTDPLKNLELGEEELGLLLAPDTWKDINYIDCRYKDVTVKSHHEGK
ncbi:MAG: FtsQ-type POTRA domain-containing protein [Candidatus Omnitrophica bacterium]|nr:FtsQ-type POTRA domain-containing protein [Candidatus Omnitrophota bacterium]